MCLAHQRIGPFSPGELQKLGLILALGHRPELLVLDEPAAALDPSARRDFLKSLLEVTQDMQHTVLFATHITTHLERVASQRGSSCRRRGGDFAVAKNSIP